VVTSQSTIDPVKILVGLLIAIYVLLALIAGPDIGWDFKNYHYYVGHRFWSGDVDRNIFPTQVQGWFNPLPDALFVGLIENVQPLVAIAVVAFLQSLIIPLLFMLLWQVTKHSGTHRLLIPNQILVGMSLVFGASGTMTLSEVGTSFSDLLISVPLLAALGALGQYATSKPSKKSFHLLLLAGFCFGFAVGLKLTFIILAPGLFAACFCLGGSLKIHMQRLILLACGAALGLAISDGYWLWHLWKMTGNPFFPAMEGLFHSDWIGSGSNLLDNRFRASSLKDILSFPLKITLGQHPGAEVTYYDLRFVIAYALAPIAFYLAVRRRLTDWPLALMVFFYINLVVWLMVFGIMRYAVPLEILSSIVLLLVVKAIPFPNYRVHLMAAITLLMLWSLQPARWMPTVAWSSVQPTNWFGVTLPEALRQSQHMFLMLSGEPTSYVIPHFPPDAIFVRMEGNLNPAPGSILYEKRRAAIAEHHGSFLTLGPTPPNTSQQDLLATYRLIRTNEPCLLVTSHLDTLYACIMKMK